MNPFIDPKKRGVSLPAGCKDLIDLLKLETVSHDFKTAATDEGFVITARLPDLRSGDIEITVEGNTLRIAGRKTDTHPPFESVFHVPAGYRISDARAACVNGELRIVVPKA